MAEAQATATAAMAAAANATMRRSIQSISEDGNAAAAAAAGDFTTAAAGSSRSRQRSRVQSPAEVMMAAAAAAAAAAGVNSSNELHGMAGGACEYPHVFEAASPTENPFRADPTPAAAAAAALAAAAAATAATEPASLSAEPSVELAVLGEKRLVSGSVFGPSYWAGLDQGRRASSGSAGSHSPRGVKLVSFSAAAAAGEAPARSHAAAAGDVVECEAHPEVSVPQQQQQRRRMTYDAVVTSGTMDRVRAERSAAAVESYLAGASAATAAGAGADARRQEGVTDTYAAEMLSQGPRGMSPSGPLVGGDEGAGKKKLGWFARVRLGHSSGGGGSKVKTAAATIDAAAAAVAVLPPNVTDSSDSKRVRKERAAAAAKAQKQQQLLLKSVTAAAGGDTGACSAAGSSSVQPVKRSAGGVLFGRWSKQARKAKAGTSDADHWPSATGAPQGRLLPAATSPSAAAYTAERGSSPPLGHLRQYNSHPTGGGASSRGQSSGGDVRGTNSDQTFGQVSAAVEAGGAWAAAGYSAAAGKAGIGVEEEGVKQAGGKWRRRLLGGRAGAQQA
jgi:hypothetical protein